MAESVALKGMDAENKRTFMLDKAYEVLAEVGYNQLTLDMVAEKVRVSKGTISYYFKNKEELIAETYLYLFDSFLADVNKHAAKSSDPKQNLANYIETVWSCYWENAKYPKIFQVYYDLWFQGIYNKRLYEVSMKTDERIIKTLYRLLKNIYNGNSAQKSAEINTKLLTIVALIDGAAKLVLSGPKTVQKENLIQEVKATVMKIID